MHNGPLWQGLLVFPSVLAVFLCSIGLNTSSPKDAPMSEMPDLSLLIIRE